jgi:hypothetical protein
MRRLVRDSSIGVVATILIAASLAGARGHDRSRPKSADVDVPYSATIPNGPTLQPGSYKIELVNDSTSAKVDFYQNGALVAEAPVELVDTGSKFSQTEVYYYNPDNSTRVMTQIDLKGETQKAMLAASDSSAVSAK